MFKKYSSILKHARVILLFSLMTPVFWARGGLEPYNLSTEYAFNPIGVDVRDPRFGWKLESSQRGQFQHAYHVVVATNPARLRPGYADAWDSGKVISDQTLEVLYQGKPLQSGERYYWKVKVWDKNDEPSSWSHAAFFETGLLAPSGWQGKWIGWNQELGADGEAVKKNPSQPRAGFPVPLLRREFEVTRRIASARMYICGLGLYNLRINGRPVNDSVLNPAQTQYGKTDLYATYDVSKLIKKGANCVGVELGRGFFDIQEQTPWDWNKAPWVGSPRMLCQLNIRYQDGTRDSVVSDSSWKLCTNGPTRYDSIYWGETYDARQEKPGWNLPGYDNKEFQDADVLPAPLGRLRSQMLPLMRIVETRRPVKVSQPKPNCYVFDVGLVTAGWATFTAACPAGTKITIRYAERLDSDGTVNRWGLNISNDPCQTDVYIFKGEGRESWEPSFSYRGFKYVEISGCPVSLSTNDVEIEVVHSDVETIGTFNCSNPLFNQLHENTVRTILNGLHGIPTEPTYEKSGWMGDANVILETALYNFDMTRFLEKWVDDMRDSMADNGLMPIIVPTGGWGMGHSPEWNSAYVFAPWHLCQYCGDQQLFRRQYPNLKEYCDHEIKELKDDISNSILNDWASPGADPHGSKPGRGCAAPEGGTLTGTAYTYRALQIMASIAQATGNHQDAERYTAVCENIQNAFNRRFLDPEKDYYHTEIPAGYRQTSTILPLEWNLAPESKRDALLKNLVADIKSKDDHLDTGVLGTKYILPVLTDAGYGSVAYAIANQKTYPSLGWWAAKRGATTMWETWEETCRSNDHCFFGTVDEWFYKYLAGIRSGSDGFKTITIRPYILGDLTNVCASINSVRGIVASSWNLKAKKSLTLKVTIPAGCLANVYVPALSASVVKEGGLAAAQPPGIKFVRYENGCAQFHVGSGNYVFSSEINANN